MTTKVLSLIQCVGLYFFLVVFSVQPSLADDLMPYMGEIIVDNVHVRAGQSANYESLCKLEKGYAVLVVDKSYSWLKVKLPVKAKSYISKQFVEINTEYVGSVTGNRVNVRSGPGSKYSVLGQAIKDQEVYMLETKDDWIKIRPLDESYGWVKEEFIKFKSKEIKQEKTEAKIAPKKKIAVTAKEAVVKKTESEVVEKKTLTVKPINTAKKLEGLKGLLKPVYYLEDKSLRHKLIIDGKTIYYLMGMNQILDEFLNMEVHIKGQVSEKHQNQLTYPIYEVKEIKLVL